MGEGITVKVEHTIPTQRIADLIITAVEGGIGYWASDFVLETPERSTLSESPWYASPELYDGRPFVIKVTVYEDDGETVTRELNESVLQNGFRIMAEKYPHHLSDFLSENEDANTADVFLQCCLFSDVVYG